MVALDCHEDRLQALGGGVVPANAKRADALRDDLRRRHSWSGRRNRLDSCSGTAELGDHRRIAWRDDADVDGTPCGQRQVICIFQLARRSVRAWGRRMWRRGRARGNCRCRGPGWRPPGRRCPMRCFKVGRGGGICRRIGCSRRCGSDEMTPCRAVNIDPAVELAHITALLGDDRANGPAAADAIDRTR